MAYPMRTFGKLLAVTSALATVTLTLAGCSGSDADGDAAAGAAEKTKVTYLTAFNAFGREAYAWVAEEKGYFEDAGLDVDIQIGSGSGENMAALASGAADFTPVDSTGYILTKASGRSMASLLSARCTSSPWSAS